MKSSRELDESIILKGIIDVGNACQGIELATCFFANKLSI